MHRLHPPCSSRGLFRRRSQDGARGGPAGVARNHALGRLRDRPLGIMTGCDAFADGEVIRTHEKRSPKTEKAAVERRKASALRQGGTAPQGAENTKMRLLGAPLPSWGAIRNEGEPGAFQTMRAAERWLIRR